MNVAPGVDDPVAYLRGTRAIRERCAELYQQGLAGTLDHFHVRPERLDGIVSFVKIDTLSNYPDLQVPHHSRWRHFNGGEIDRATAISDLLKELNPRERCRAKVELSLLSALLDVDPGNRWTFRDVDTSMRNKGSEGLALAAVYGFWEGAFGDPLSATSTRLKEFSSDDLARTFQLSSDNQIVRPDARHAILNSLGRIIETRRELFKGSPGRLGGILESVLAAGDGKGVDASAILAVLLDAFADLWGSGVKIAGRQMGDVWKHSKVGGAGDTRGIVPIHRVAQWMVYSLVEPLADFGITVRKVEELTGLADYSNGGLFLDGGVLTPKDPSALGAIHSVSSEFVVEWRALTVALLDETAKRLPAALGKGSNEFPLSKVLQGGTWSAGRKFAAGRRSDGTPPIKVESDGTIF